MADEIVPEITEHQASLLTAPHRIWTGFGIGQLLMRKASPGNVGALIEWVGRVGFDEAVKYLTARFGEERAKKIAGKLKKMADERGQLAPEHAYGKSGLFRRIPLRTVGARLLRFTAAPRDDEG